MRFQFGVLVVAFIGLIASVAVVPTAATGTGLNTYQSEHLLQHRYGEPHESHQHEVPAVAQFQAVSFDGVPAAVALAVSAPARVSAANQKLAGLSVAPLVAPPRAPIA